MSRQCLHGEKEWSRVPLRKVNTSDFGIDEGGKWPLLSLWNESVQRTDSDQWHASGKREHLSSHRTDAHACVGSRPYAYYDRLELLRSKLERLQSAVNQRN